MRQGIKAEWRKLITVRSTLFLVLGALLLVLLFAGFATGYRATHANLVDPTYLSQQILNAVMTVNVLAGLACLLLFGNEYRHNTIIYSLTLSRSRSRVLAAKIIVSSLFVVGFALAVMVLSPLATVIGAHLHGHSFANQTLDYGNLLWRSLFYAWGYAMFALVIIAIIRNQIGAIVVLLFVPSAVESILSLMLRNNAKFLPFSALGNVVNTQPMYGGKPAGSALIALCYIVVFWSIAWYLFLRRDAN